MFLHLDLNHSALKGLQPCGSTEYDTLAGCAWGGQVMCGAPEASTLQLSL